MDIFGKVDFLNLEYFFYKIYQLVTGIVFIEFPFGMDLARFIKTLIAIIAIILITLILYLVVRIYEVKKTANFLTKEYFEKPSEKKENTRWQEVLKHVHSANPPGWRLAVIEADAMLDELLIYLGYEGESLGERLKKVDINHFNTLDYAWEAHKVRNKIAHEGLNYHLTQYEAKRVVNLYEKVFKEFGII